MKLSLYDIRMARGLIEKFQKLNEYNLINQVTKNMFFSLSCVLTKQKKIYLTTKKEITKQKKKTKK